MSKNTNQRIKSLTPQNVFHFTLLLKTCGATFIRRKRIKHKVP